MDHARKTYQLMNCGNPECSHRKMLVKGLSTEVPDNEPPDRVHRVPRHGAPRQPIVCPKCGHYTVSPDG
jgi:hypothetical protein